MLVTSKEETLAKWEHSFPPGWKALIEKILVHMDQVKAKVEIAQIKEKFGTLRCYYDVVYDQEFPEDKESLFYRELKSLENFVWNMESFSGIVCQDCGTTVTAKLRPLSWRRTLCDTCVKSYDR